MTRKPIAGGAMILITGILGLINYIIIVLAAGELARMFQPTSLAPERIVGASLVFLVLNLAVIAGGIEALRRRRWGLALAAGILGIVVGGFVIGNLLAIVGSVIVAAARREFVGHREYVAERRLTGA